MPNKRHPAKKYIGFWGTEGLKKRLLEEATGTTLSKVIVKYLWDALTGQRKADRPLLGPRSNKKKR
jgi:hypothetical protein